jgi:hypothetical protein
MESIKLEKSLQHIIEMMARQIDLLQNRVTDLENAMPCPHRETEEDYSFDGESENRVDVCTACGETL